jgi:ribonuclease HII
MKGMKEAVDKLAVHPDLILIDGNKVPDGLNSAQFVISGDAKQACIAAASILAKVTRDRYIVEMSKKYPQYGFEKHKGYGTAEHMQAIRQHGILPIHRRSFLKNSNPSSIRHHQM